MPVESQVVADTKKLAWQFAKFLSGGANIVVETSRAQVQLKTRLRMCHALCRRVVSTASQALPKRSQRLFVGNVWKARSLSGTVWRRKNLGCGG